MSESYRARRHLPRPAGMSGHSLNTSAAARRNREQPPSEANPPYGLLVCFWVSWALLLVVDPLRKVLPGAPGFLSLLPLAANLVGFLLLHRMQRCAILRLLAPFWRPLMCVVVIGLAVAAFRKQASWQAVLLDALTLTMLVPCSIVAAAALRPPSVREKFAVFMLCTALTTTLLALMHTAGRVSWQILAALEGVTEFRQIDGETVQTACSVFRSNLVFSSFLAVTVPFSMSLAKGSRNLGGTGHGILSLIPVAGILVALAGTLLSAKRAGVALLLVAVLYGAGHLRTGIVRASIAVVCAVGILAAALGSPALRARLGFVAATQQEAARRGQMSLEGVFNEVKQASLFGVGLGHYVSGVQHVDPETSFLQKEALRQNELLHFGWLKSLQKFGLLGMPLHLMSAGGLLWVLFRGLKHQSPGAEKAGAATSAMIVAAAYSLYFFVATSWLENVSAGPLFGTVIGCCLCASVSSPTPSVEPESAPGAPVRRQPLSRRQRKLASAERRAGQRTQGLSRQVDR